MPRFPLRPLVLSLALIGPLTLSPSAHAARIRLAVSGATSSVGEIRAVLCSRQEFDGLRCSRSAHASVRGETASLTFEAPAGRYAIAVFHDRYADGRIHRSFFGLPKQGVGFSRNPLLLGAPSFERTAFDLPVTGRSIEVRLCFEPAVLS